MVDLLTDVLQAVRVADARCTWVEDAESCPVQHAKADGAVIYAVTSGLCTLETAGAAATSLNSGDVVLLAHGSEHRLSRLGALDSDLGADAPDSRIEGLRPDSREPAPLRLIRIEVTLENRRHNPVVTALPPIVRLVPTGEPAPDWLASTLQFMMGEASSELPGSSSVLCRLSDVLLMQLVRTHLRRLETLPVTSEDSPGWLAAISEPQIGGALGLIHESPAEPWTVARLAARVGMSRSAFAARFAQLVGEPPLHYVTRWRMQRAASLLRGGESTLVEVAAQVGYESEAAFSKAFKRWAGVAPGAYRRSSKATGMATAA